MPDEKLALGILGGMGPQATIDLQQKILDLTKALRDGEHIHVYVDNYPQIPDRIGAILRDTLSPVTAMQEALDKLIAQGAKCIVMPCISAHYFLPQLKVPPQINFIDMLQITAAACKEQLPSLTAGVLCSEATAQSGLFTKYLRQRDIPYVYPGAEEQRLIGRLILDIKAKADLEAVLARLKPIADDMKKKGADYFVLACTELPLLTQNGTFPYPFLDATTELAKAAVLCCGYQLAD